MNGPNNSIGWCDYTWTPITGCKRNCWYCYVKNIINYSMTPQFHPERLQEPLKLKKTSKIFVCSTADIFGEWVIEDWIRQVLEIIKQCPQHTFQILTKCPERAARFMEYLDKPNVWLGTTVEDNNHVSRLRVLQLLARQYGLTQTFVSFEPLLSNIELGQDGLFGISWIIMGAYTNKADLKKAERFWPKSAWVLNLLSQAALLKIPVYMKDNLTCRGGIKKQEFPKR